MAKQKSELVHCRYPKCKNLHETTELKKEDAVQSGGGHYYHHDCYHTMQTVNQIRDLFIKEINPAMTRQQIGILVSTINNMMFSKQINVDLIKFALEYFVQHKPGALHTPFGLHYIVQNKDVIMAWKKYQEKKSAEYVRAMKEKINIDSDNFEFNLPENTKTYKQSNMSKFSRVLGAQ